MKKALILISIVLLATSVQASIVSKALGVITGSDLNLFKASFAEKADAMVKIQQDALAKVEARVGNIETNLSAAVTARDVEAKIAAYDSSKKISNAVGGNQDNSKAITNDTSLMKYIVYILGGICIWLIKSNTTKDRQISDLITRNSAKELKIYEMANAHTKTLLDMINAELVDDNKKGDMHIG